jgi:hypothetical protein
MRKTEIASGRLARSLLRGLRSRRQGAGWREPRVNRFLATRWTSNTRRGPLRARSSPDLHRLRFPQNRPVLGAERPAASYQKFSCYRYENLTRDKSGCSPVPGRADVWTPNPRSRGLPAVTRETMRKAGMQAEHRHPPSSNASSIGVSHRGHPGYRKTATANRAVGALGERIYPSAMKHLAVVAAVSIMSASSGFAAGVDSRNCSRWSVAGW